VGKRNKKGFSGIKGKKYLLKTEKRGPCGKGGKRWYWRFGKERGRDRESVGVKDGRDWKKGEVILLVTVVKGEIVVYGKGSFFPAKKGRGGGNPVGEAHAGQVNHWYAGKRISPSEK